MTSFNGLIDHIKIYDYARTPAQIAWDYNRGKPIAHYKLDEVEGTTAHDSSENNLHGTLGTGTSSPTWVTGKLNNAASFDGNDDYISIPSDPSLQITNNFTVTIWFKPTNLTQSQKYIIGKNNDYSIVWEYTDNTAQFYTNGQTGTNPMSYSQITIPNTNWHHISYTYDGINLKSFLNGKLVLNNPITFSCRISSSPLAIGAANDSPTNPVNGLIDDVRIYNYALTDKQIQTLYNSGAVSFN